MSANNQMAAQSLGFCAMLEALNSMP